MCTDKTVSNTVRAKCQTLPVRNVFRVPMDICRMERTAFVWQKRGKIGFWIGFGTKERKERLKIKEF